MDTPTSFLRAQGIVLVLASWLLLGGCTPKGNQAASPPAGAAARPFMGTWEKPGTNGKMTVTFNADGSYTETGSTQPRPLRSVYDPGHQRALQAERGGESPSLTGRWSEVSRGVLAVEYSSPPGVYSQDQWQVSQDGKKLTLSTVSLNRRRLRVPAAPDVYERR